MPSPLFQFDAVVVAVAGTTLLDGVSASIPDRGVTVVAGPSGAGKTTLLRLCNRLEAPTAGRVSFRGDDIAQLDPMALRRRVGMVFQRPVLFPGTVCDNLRVAAPHDEEEHLRQALVRAALVPAFLDRRADALSAGEAQRVALARTLVTEPEALLLDEPTSAVDAAAGMALESVARDLAHDGVPVVWVTHDAAQLHRLADHVVILQHGRVVFAGDPHVDGASSEVARLMAGETHGH